MRLRAAVVGCGRIGTNTDPKLRGLLPHGWLPLSHAEAIAVVSELELVGLCDLDSERVARACAQHPSAAGFTDYRALIRELRPDLLTVATRTEVRCDIIAFAVENGVTRIHAEKPFSRNLRDCERALALIERRGARLSYGTTRRCMDIYRAARSLVAAGEIGELRQIVIEHGAAALLWAHPHSVDLILFLSGCADVESVQGRCRIDPASVRADVVDQDPIVEHAFIRLKSGVSGVITAVDGNNTVLAGTRGTLVIRGDGSCLELYRPRSESDPYRLQMEPRPVSVTMSGTQRALHELSTDQGPSITPGEIACGQRVLLSLVMSSLRNGASFSPGDLDPDFTVTGRSGSLYA